MKKQKKIIFTVTTDLSYDQRMERICTTLAEAGYDILLCGRRRTKSPFLQSRPYKQKRFSCFFQKGKLFYLEYNLRLFLFLLYTPADLICGVDLDTALPAFTVARFKKIPFVYDAHEYFTQMEEVVKRPAIQKVWLAVEKWVLPRTRYAYTVSQSIAEILEKEYGTPFQVIRNVSRLRALPDGINNAQERYIIYAGAVNQGRGLEQLIDAMPEIDAKLYICGDGEVLPLLKKKVQSLQLESKVVFWGFVLPQELHRLIREAYAGYLLLTRDGLSYYYSLANKFFDYMHAGIPQVTINFPEYKSINAQYEVAALIDLDTAQIKDTFQKLIYDQEYYDTLALNALKARKIFNWECEAKKLIAFYENIFSNQK